MQPSRILIVRLGAMGDVIHGLPTASTLRRNFPGARITWIVDPKWRALLEGNSSLDEILEFDRRSWSSVAAVWRILRQTRFDLAIDLQGLTKSAVIAGVSGAQRRIGFSAGQVRERAAALFYNTAVHASAKHVVDRSLELAQAAGVSVMHYDFPLPAGRAGGELPDGPFVLACPLAGWTSKQWPAEHYAMVARALREEGSMLVVNGAPEARAALSAIAGAHVHVSGIAGLIDATRRAAGVIGVDSGPLHLAAALGKPGVAIFGPTDPARNGPYGNSINVLRDPRAVTTYRRGDQISPSMRAILPETVIEALHRAAVAARTAR